MTDREKYVPGPASGAQVRKDGDNWTLILVRELRHSPEKVWRALTDPVHLREWAPFEADVSLANTGTTVKLTTVGAPTPQVSETRVTQAEASVPPRLKEWAYAGFAINLASALIAHLSVGDGPEAWSRPAATGVLWALSYLFWGRLQARPLGLFPSCYQTRRGLRSLQVTEHS